MSSFHQPAGQDRTADAVGSFAQAAHRVDLHGSELDRGDRAVGDGVAHQVGGAVAQRIGRERDALGVYGERRTYGVDRHRLSHPVDQKRPLVVARPRLGGAKSKAQHQDNPFHPTLPGTHPRSRHLGTFDSRRNRWAKRIGTAHDILACALVFGGIAYLALVL